MCEHLHDNVLESTEVAFLHVFENKISQSTKNLETIIIFLGMLLFFLKLFMGGKSSNNNV